MFKGAQFYIHDSVVSADDVGAQLQEHGGRICLNYKRADVILVDRARSASVASLVAQQAEIVDSSWVGLCLKHGRRLPYTYQAPRREAEARLMSINDDDLAGGTKQPLPPLHQPGIIPLPDVEVISFRARVGTAGCPTTVQTQALNDYFVRFMIAIWTMDPDRSTKIISEHIFKILPRLSEWSLHTFAKANHKQVEYARAQAASARADGRFKHTQEFIDNEIRKTSNVLATRYPSLYTSGGNNKSAKVRIATARSSKSPLAQASQASPRGSRRHHQQRARTRSAIPSSASVNLGSPMSIGGSSIVSLLLAPGLPDLPTSTSPEAKNAFCDEVLRWVLEREPNATQRSICALVHAMGRGDITFSKGAFRSSYRTAERRKRYQKIRQSVQQRWYKGELGNIKSKHRANRLPDSDSEDAEADVGQNGGRTSHTSVSTASSPANSKVELAMEDDEEMHNILPDADIAARAISSSPAMALNSEPNLQSTLHLPAPEGGQELLEPKMKATAPQALFTKTDTDTVPLKPKEPEQQERMSPEILHEMAHGHMWFEGFAAELNLNTGTEDYEAKRAPIWRDMVQKFGHDEPHWKNLYELNQREVETRVMQLKGRTTTYRF